MGEFNSSVLNTTREAPFRLEQQQIRDLSYFIMGKAQFLFVCIMVIHGALLVNGHIGRYCKQKFRQCW